MTTRRTTRAFGLVAVGVLALIASLSVSTAGSTPISRDGTVERTLAGAQRLVDQVDHHAPVIAAGARVDRQTLRRAHQPVAGALAIWLLALTVATSVAVVGSSRTMSRDRRQLVSRGPPATIAF